MAADDSSFMSGWEDTKIVSERLGQALKSHHGIILSSDTTSTKTTSNTIVSSKISPLCGGSGLSGEMSLLTIAVDCNGNDTTTLMFVLKRTQSTEEKRKGSKMLGLYREATFYNIIAPLLEERFDKASSFIPRTYFSECDATTGQKAIVMEYYDEATEAGRHYLSAIHNKQGDNEAPNSLPFVDQRSLTIEVVRIGATFHGSFYKDASLLGNPKIASHLRMADWIQGQGKDTWEASQQEVCGRWAKAKSEWEKGQFYDGKVSMEQEFVDVLDASCALVDFDTYVEMWGVKSGSRGKKPWSLVHGDYHPGNFLCLHSDNTDASKDGRPNLVLLDWEFVGVGSGPQDVGQYLISHMEPSEACGMIDEIASIYRDTLIETLNATNNEHANEVSSFEELKKEIVYGGLQRWIWLYSYMCGLVPSEYMQYFHDQVHGWIVGNKISAESVGMPRP